MVWNLNQVVTITDAKVKLIASQYLVIGTFELWIMLLTMCVAGLVVGFLLGALKYNRFVAFLNANKLQDKHEQWMLSREKAKVHWGIKE